LSSQESTIVLFQFEVVDIWNMGLRVSMADFVHSP
jgi:hypothetical protein